MRGKGCNDTKVLSIYGCYTLNDNGEGLLGFAEDNKLSIANRFFSTPKGGIFHMFRQANGGKE